MKIGQVVLSLDFGGQEKLIIQLSEKLQAKNIEPVIITLNREGTLLDEARAKGLKVLSAHKGRGFDPGVVGRMKRIIKEEKIDILHTHNFAPLIYGSLAARLAGIKAVNTRHGRANIRAHSFFWDLNEYVIAVSQDAYTELRQNNRISNSFVKVIYNGIAIPSANTSYKNPEQFRRELGLKKDSLLIISIARLSPEKDHRTLLKALRMLSDQKTNVELLIVGGGELEKELKQFVENLGIAGRVKFLGFRNDIADLLHLCDVFVLSSLMEGVSLTILEAMANSRSVVATHVGGNPEVVREEKTGLLVSIKDPTALAGALKKVLSDKLMAQRYGAEGRKVVSEKFNLDTMVDSYVDVYASVLKGTVPSWGQSPKPKPKILVFTNVFPRDFEPQKGPNIYEQLKRLRQDFNIKIISAIPKSIFPDNKRHLPQRTLSDDFEIYQPRYWIAPKIGVAASGYSYYRAVAPVVKKIRQNFPFELIIAYWTYPDGFAAAKIARKFNVPMILRPRGSDINVGLMTPFVKNFIKKTLNNTDKIIPVAESLRQKILNLGIPAERLRCIVNGVDTQNFFPLDKSACRQKLNIPLDKKVVLFVGNLIEIKGLEYFLPAIQKLDTEANRQMIFYLLGSGKLEAQIRQMAEGLKHIKVHLPGEVNRQALPTWMNAADLFCLPSLNEGCPNVLMESLACGVPVVATKVGGIPEIINNGELGILVPAANSEQLAAAIMKGLNHPWRQKDLLARVQRETWDKVVEKLKDECIQLIQHRLAPTGNQKVFS